MKLVKKKVFCFKNSTLLTDEKNYFFFFCFLPTQFLPKSLFWRFKLGTVSFLELQSLWVNGFFIQRIPLFVGTFKDKQQNQNFDYTVKATITCGKIDKKGTVILLR